MSPSEVRQLMKQDLGLNYQSLTGRAVSFLIVASGVVFKIALNWSDRCFTVLKRVGTDLQCLGEVYEPKIGPPKQMVAFPKIPSCERIHRDSEKMTQSQHTTFLDKTDSTECTPPAIPTTTMPEGTFQKADSEAPSGRIEPPRKPVRKEQKKKPPPWR